MGYKFETKVIRKEKDPIDVEMSLCVLRGTKGKIVGSVGIIEDVSKKKIVEHKLKYERDILQSLLDNVPDSIYFKDKKGRFVKVNKSITLRFCSPL